MEIYGILGFKGSGKDTAAQALLNVGFKKYAFADAVKDVLASTFCWPREWLEGASKEGREWREQVDPWWAEKLGIPHFTPRFAMTNIGTDVMRKHFHDDIWILNTMRRIELDGNDKIVFTDCRFPNEAAAIRKIGGKLIRVAKGPEPEFWMYSSLSVAQMSGYEYAQHMMRTKYAHVHPSEWLWNNIPVDGRIENDTTVETLHNDILALRDKLK